jgi:hypothetical protein
MSSTVNDLETLANALSEPDFDVTQDDLNASVKLESRLSQAPETLSQAGDMLNPPVTGTAVKNRILLISAECYIPLKYLAIQEGNRMVGLTALGWSILKEMPSNKSERPAFFDEVDNRWGQYLPQEKDEPIVVVEAEEVTEQDFAAIVQRKVDNLVIPVSDAVTMNSLVNFGDFNTLKILARQAGRAMGQQLGSEIATGMNEGIIAAQQGIRAGMLQSTEGL